MGVYLQNITGAWVCRSFPHACGGVPSSQNSWQAHQQFSPRMWGCTGVRSDYELRHNVFPTHVGVYRIGCSYGFQKTPVFPTHVGVYRFKFAAWFSVESFPHACGGVPTTLDYFEISCPFSPRMWGCTLTGCSAECARTVFPTHVGVYLRPTPQPHNESRFPHACGGVPEMVSRGTVAHAFSPRMWGCTASVNLTTNKAGVFPTHVGVYHILPAGGRGTPAFSPRMWGCTVRGAGIST